jgi:hypothetical protein
MAIYTFFNKHDDNSSLLDLCMFDCIPTVLRVLAFSMSYFLWALKFQSMIPHVVEDYYLQIQNLIGKLCALSFL